MQSQENRKDKCEEISYEHRPERALSAGKRSTLYRQQFSRPWLSACPAASCPDKSLIEALSNQGKVLS
eukprot:3775047-Rhodomonas_salina.1